MKIDIQDVLEVLQSDSTEKEKQMNLIKNIDWTKSVTEKEWHQICETLLRTSDLLCNLLKNTFPNATDIKLEMNYVNFNLYGFRCQLPTARYEEILVDMSWNKKLKEPTLENYYTMYQFERNMKKYFELLDSHGYWLELFDLRFPIFKHYKKWIKFILWFGKYKWKDVHREQWEEQFKKTEERVTEKLNLYEKEKREIEEKNKILHEKLLPELYQFTKNVYDKDYKKEII